MTRRTFLEASGLALGAAPVRVDMQTRAGRPLPKSEFDYVDWSWATWRSITRESAPTVTSEQSMRAELMPLLDDRVPLSAEAWERRRGDYRALLASFLGTPPDRRSDLRAQTVEETSAEDTPSGSIRRRLVSYEVEPGERITACLLIPEASGRRLPAILCPHQTTQAGWKEPAGLAGNPELHTALHLARRGFVTLTYDALCFGQRHDAASGHYGDAIPFYRKRPAWSLLGKMVWDLARGIDYLGTLDFVDPARIGSVGHSHGGITTLWGMALDGRIRAGASNCGYDTFRLDGNVFRWSHATALLPRLGFYLKSPYIDMDTYRGVPDSEVIRVPFDQHMLLALIAPRPLLLSASDDDFVFPNGGWSTRRSMARLGPVYQALGAPDRLATYYWAGGHRLPAHASARAYDWLEHWLKADHA